MYEKRSQTSFVDILFVVFARNTKNSSISVQNNSMDLKIEQIIYSPRSEILQFGNRDFPENLRKLSGTDYLIFVSVDCNNRAKPKSLSKCWPFLKSSKKSCTTTHRKFTLDRIARFSAFNWTKITVPSVLHHLVDSMGEKPSYTSKPKILKKSKMTIEHKWLFIVLD